MSLEGDDRPSSSSVVAASAEPALRAAAAARKEDRRAALFTFTRVATPVLAVVAIVVGVACVTGAAYALALDQLAALDEAATLLVAGVVPIVLAFALHRWRSRLKPLDVRDATAPIGTRVVRRSPRRIGAIVGIVVVVVALTLVVTACVWIRVAVHDSFLKSLAKLDDNFALFGDAFRADRARARELPIFTGVGSERDAGPFLNPLLSWRDSTHVPTEAERESSTGLLKLPEPWPDAIERLDFDAAAPLVKGLDSSWLAQIKDADHWDWDSGSPRAVGPYSVGGSPLPNLMPLMHWAKVRAVQGYADGDLRAASADIQHLGRLCASSETVLGLMVGLAIFRTDEKLLEVEALKNRNLDLSWWRPLSQADSKLLRRAAFAAIAYANPFTPDDDWRLLDGSSPLDCVGLNEGLSELRSSRPWLQSEIPARYDDARRRVRDARTHCRFHRLAETWDEAEPDGGDWCAAAPQSDGCVFSKIARYVPGTSREIARLEAVHCSDTTSSTCPFAAYENP